MKPVLTYDGDCGFCRMWVDCWRGLTGDAVEYVASGASPEAVEYATGDERSSGEHSSGARAVFELLAGVPGRGGAAWAYRRIPGFAAITEWSYRTIAAHRTPAYWATRALWGRKPCPPTYRTATKLFGRALAIIYLIAFASFAAQAAGLIGSQGILPWGHGDAGWLALTWAGSIAALLAMLAPSGGWVQRGSFTALFLLYGQTVAAGQIFMGYQWDYLLLEAGFLAIFLSPAMERMWLFQWLLFRLMFESGAVKLQSHDVTWSGLTALTYHYWTQPLPTPLAWYMAQAPLWFSKASAAFVFAIELGLPFLMLGPRRLKQIAALGTTLLQVLILLTGNYTFFNWLTIALCLTLLDDGFFGRRAARPMKRRANAWVTAALLIFVMAVSGAQLAALFGERMPRAFRTLEALAAPYGVVNQYGLFASMTTTRPEISVEGSDDGTTWKPYVFRYKAGPLDRRPPWVAPYQPRLDWQMWFAALGGYEDNPWFAQFLMRLLQGSKPVLALMERDPFGRPPKYIRAQVYQYRFTDEAERRKTGAWWKREPVGVYFPAVSLKSSLD